MAALANEAAMDHCAKPCCTLPSLLEKEATKRSNLSYFGIGNGEEFPGNLLESVGGNTLIVGSKAKLEETFSKGRCDSLLPVGIKTKELLMICSNLCPGRDITHSSILETHCMGKDDTLSRVSVCALPTQVSRHNCPASPHAITDFVRSKKGGSSSSNLTVIVVLEKDEHCFASGIAVARAFPQFFTKKGYGGSKHFGGKGNQGRDYGEMVAVCAQGPEKRVNVVMVYPENVPENNAELIKTMGCVSDGILLAQRLVDAPTNYMHTDMMVSECEAVYDKLKSEVSQGNISMQVIRGEELRDRGFGLLWGVGKAAVHKPALVVLSWTPPDAKKGGIALCGKGIVYDSGGLSIKGKTAMPGMKRDMGGSATVLGAWQSIVRLGSSGNTPVHALE